jgi:hypothetical protein
MTTKTTKPKIKEVTIAATVPTMQYGNLQPSITLQGADVEEVTNTGLQWIEQIHSVYGEKPLTKKAMSVVATTKERSYNEEDVEIEYDAINHKYYYNGKELMGVTDYLKSFTAPFDASSIAKKCAEPWGMEAEDIQAMWNQNGNITSMFGTAVHEAIEHYLTYSKLRGEAAIPKHPVLRKIVTEFLEIYHDEEQVSEVLVTDVANGFCGRTDSIAERRKQIGYEIRKDGEHTPAYETKLVVQDWKINIESEVEDRKYKLKAPFDNLPPTKLSKYQVQMSMYANMLEHSGMDVADFAEVYVYEDKWIKYELPVLDVLYGEIKY